MIHGRVSFLISEIGNMQYAHSAEYDQYQTDFFACTQLTTPDYPVYVTASPTVAHSISGKGAIFLKPTQMFRYVAISIFGEQIVSTQTGTEHRRHKNVVKGCFGENIMVAAFDGMIEAMGTMFKELNLDNGGVFEDTRAAMNKVSRLLPHIWRTLHALKAV